MKQKIIWFPVLCVLSASIALSGCATNKDLSDLYIAGAVVGVVGLIALLLPDKEDSNPEEQLNTDIASINEDAEDESEKRLAEELPEKPVKATRKEPKEETAQDFIFEVTPQTFSEVFADRNFSDSQHDNVILVSGEYDREKIIALASTLDNVNRLVVDFSGVKNMHEVPAELFSECTTLQRVELPATITSIAFRAFQNCQNLAELILPNSLEKIERHAFSGCSSLTQLLIPETVSFIGEEAFAGCSSLREMVLPGLSYIAPPIFKDCANLIKVYFKDSDQQWPYWSNQVSIFEDCPKLQYVRLPKGARASLKGCDSIEVVYLPEDCYISFEGCTNLKEVVIENGVKEFSFYEEPFIGCKNLERMKIPASVESLCYTDGNPAFPYGFPAFPDSPHMRFEVDPKNRHFKSADNGKLLTSKDGRVLYGMSYVSGNVTLPTGVSILQNDTLLRGYKIDTLTIPENIQYIGHEGFMKTTIKKVVLNGTVYLDSHTFYQCQNLETVVINGTITNKFPENYYPPVSGSSGWLFDECTNLKNVIINGTIETGLEHWFRQCTSLESFSLPENLALVDGSELDGTFSGCVNLTQFKLGNNRNFSVSDDGRILYTKDRKTLVSYPSATGDIVLPADILSVGSKAFIYNDTITSVMVPANIVSLGAEVFGSCQNITTITIHNNFKTVSDFYSAFSDCRNLQTINFHGTQKEWEQLIATANEWELSHLQNVTVNIISQ